MAKVAVENAAYHFDKLYDYRVPPGMALAPGQRVMVPFGRGKAPKRLGLVLKTEEVPEGELPAGIKEIASAADLEPVLDGEMLQLLRWLRGETFCTWFDGVKVLLPGGYGMKSQTAFSLCRGAEGEALTPEEGQILDYLRPRKNPAPEEELLEALGLVRGHPALRSLEERGLILRQDLLKRRVKDQKLQMVRLAPDWERAFLTPKQQAVLELLQQAGCASVKEICYFAGVTKGVVDNFVKAGGGVYYLEETYRDPYQEAERAGGREAIALSPQQQGAAEQLEAVYRRRDGSTALLFGVTGSGKTQVFMKLIDRALEDGRQAIVLVPEISLTPQTIKKFHSHYGSRVAVLHSGLSMSQRLDEWKRARRGLVDVVVGTRSAVFAPLPRLGLMVIDEEQEHTYQSESAPRFDAREAARVRMKLRGGMSLLCSATPSVESYYRGKQGVYTLVELSGRYGPARLPSVTILDMQSQEIPAEGLSQELCQEIHQNLQSGEQTILLMNRRGYSTQVKCTSCHTAVECPNCSITMKYHSANNRLMCHYCGYSAPVPESCPVCGSEFMKYTGLGTQRVEEVLRERWPQARVLRMDMDTTMRRDSHEGIRHYGGDPDGGQGAGLPKRHPGGGADGGPDALQRGFPELRAHLLPGDPGGGTVRPGGEAGAGLYPDLHPGKPHPLGCRQPELPGFLPGGDSEPEIPPLPPFLQALLRGHHRGGAGGDGEGRQGGAGAAEKASPGGISGAAGTAAGPFPGGGVPGSRALPVQNPD